MHTCSLFRCMLHRWLPEVQHIHFQELWEDLSCQWNCHFRCFLWFHEDPGLAVQSFALAGKLNLNDRILKGVTGLLTSVLEYPDEGLFLSFPVVSSVSPLKWMLY